MYALLAGAVELADFTSSEGYPPLLPLIRPSVGFWRQSVKLEDRILVAEQSVTQQPKWSCGLQHSTMALTGEAQFDQS